MRTESLPGMLLISSCLLFSACTRTVIQEVPAADADTESAVETTPGGPLDDAAAAAATSASDSDQTGNSLPQSPQQDQPLPAAPAGGNDPVPAANTPVANTPAGQQTTTPDSSGPASNDAGFDTTHPAQTAGLPGETVDCLKLLPCRWISSDSALSVTVGAADNIAAMNALAVDFVISTSHDTELSLGSGATAADSMASYTLTRQSLGEGNGNSALSVLAGKHSSGRFIYDKPAQSASLGTWSIIVLDGSLPRVARFENIPIGPEISPVVDCLGSLPCVWQSGRQDITLSIVSSGGYAGNGRLNVSFSLLSNRDMSVSLNSGAYALGVGNIEFNGRTHSLGTETGYAELTATSIAGRELFGSVTFSRTQQIPQMLKSLELVVYENSPVARWRPRFSNIPTQ